MIQYIYDMVVKKMFLAFVSLVFILLSAVPSLGQITGVELARSKQKDVLMTQDNDQVIREVSMDADIVV